MAGPKIPWRPGRIDGFAAQATPDGRLPDATQGADHLRNIFYRMGYVATYKSLIKLTLFFFLYPVSMTKKSSLFLVHMHSVAATLIVLALRVLGHSLLPL